ncbi:carbohydrate-binding module family 52 protein [Xylariaceae sp. FL0662B]|nr:carbohydrate-binding module family 52 protein [Xylariaceae sp. FL0662B]
MSIWKAFALTKQPLPGKLQDWINTDRQQPDDDQHLLEDDPLSIPLESNEPVPESTAGQSTDQKGTPRTSRRSFCYDIFRSMNECRIIFVLLALVLLAALFVKPGLSQVKDDLLPCGTAKYSINHHTCYNSNFLCPVVGKQRTLRCGDNCYSPRRFSCNHGTLVEIQDSESASPPIDLDQEDCSSTYFQLSDSPYENYFISDCSTASQVVVTSPVANSDLKAISPRLLVAWPAGNSGIVAYFSPTNGINGTLAISLEKIIGSDRTLGLLVGGVTGKLTLNSSASLDLAILGSIRTIRDFIEGPSTLVPAIQDAIKIQQLPNGGIQLSRIWLDRTTETFLTFENVDEQAISINDGRPHLTRGTYIFNAWCSYPQLDQLDAEEVLNPASQSLIMQNPLDTQSLSFLSYSSKILAGAWRFLTYFGRDSLISLLLLQPILSEGDGGAVEAILSAAIERIDSKDGSVCHEETIGDYASYLNGQQGIDSTDPQCDYKMIDTDFFLPIAMNEYLVKSAVGQTRRDTFLATNASILSSNRNFTYKDLATATAEKIMGLTAKFEESPVKENLIRLKQGQDVGQWRDSNSGLGGGRIPFDVNTALVPAALKAIASLSNNSVFPSHPEWASVANKRALFWEDNTLSFFEVTVTADKARDLVAHYVDVTSFPGEVDTGELTSPVVFHGLALDGKGGQPVVKVMNTDDCFRLFFLNSTNQDQLSAFISQAADNILRPFPLGLSTSVGLVVANPAYGEDSVNVEDFAESSYHGTVVWSWQLAMMAAGLERQLERCQHEQLNFCTDDSLHKRVLKAYNRVWDQINANREHLSSEVWSWVYRDGDFQHIPLGALSRPKGQSQVGS